MAKTQIARRPLVAANWKMHGTQQQARVLVQNILQRIDMFKPMASSQGLISEVGVNSDINVVDAADAADAVGAMDIVLCPPAILIPLIAKELGNGDSDYRYNGAGSRCIVNANILVGGQNCYCQSEGAYTGEISPQMLKDFSCQYVIIGHSERRQLFAESDALIAKKFAAAYAAGVKPILCVGELQQERENGETLQVIERQLNAVLSCNLVRCFVDAVIAYEPVWAIGTGLTASPQQAQEVHAFIRGLMARLDVEIASKVRIIYGGSVKASNAAELFAQPDIDGGLIGGASLKADEFLAICSSAVS